MSKRGTVMILGCLLAVAVAAEEPRVLFLSKSSGFEHSSIKKVDGAPSHVERVLARLAEEKGFELQSTKDAGLIEAGSLANFDAVVFFTSGDLTTAGDGSKLFGGDGEGAMGPGGVADLRAWVEAGGAFLGFHSATDTFRGGDETLTPYVDFIGAEFLGHGRQFSGRLDIVDASHPAVASIPAGWEVQDEWYFFQHIDQDDMHVLALLDTTSDELGQDSYMEREPYPIIWCKTFGEGRVFYNAMGHREDVWDRPQFQAAFVDALHWALGEGEAMAEPNYAKVVP